MPRLGWLLPNDRGGLLLLWPLPASSAIVSQLWPISLSPFGIYAYVAQSINPGGRPRHIERFLRWQDVKSVGVADRDVLINEERFVRVCSSSLAFFMTDVISRLSSANQEQRDDIIDETLAFITNSSEIGRRSALFLEHSRGVVYLTSVMFILAFVAAPLLLFFGPTSIITLFAGWSIVIAYLILWMSTVLLAMSVAKRCGLPSSALRDRKRILTMCFSPVGAMHAFHLLSRDLASEFHPLAIGKVVCSQAEFRQFARQVLLDLSSPILPICPSGDTEAANTEQWFRERLNTSLQKLTAGFEFTMDELLREPERDGDDVLSYCPRCDAQYAITNGTCSHCGDIELRKFQLS